jgi:hypothetical protein
MIIYPSQSDSSGGLLLAESLDGLRRRHLNTWEGRVEVIRESESSWWRVNRTKSVSSVPDGSKWFKDYSP